jgi:hypothetical protein
MKKIYTLSFIFLASLSFGQTPIPLIGVNVPYSENFDGMGATETAFLPGWTAINTSNGSTLTMQLSDGNTNSGNVYNIGTTTSSSEDRAFGTLADATVVAAFGAVFQNNTTGTISKISIQTRMEQWRTSGNAAVNETIAFSYSTDATSLSSGTWTAVTALDLKEKLTAAASNAAVNGNLASNYTNISHIITGLNWANGTNLWIKWTDMNDAGSNGMYAIDNFIISVTEANLGLIQNTIAGLNVYPNPVTDGTLYITSNSTSEKAIAMFDVLGKQVLNSKTSNSAVNVSDLKGGVYFIKISEDGKTDTKKLVIK